MDSYGVSQSAHDLRQQRCERASWWLAQGVAVVPLQPQSKALQPGYGAHKAWVTEVAFAHQWFGRTDANLGVILGGPVGLVVADWDCAPDYAAWRLTVGSGVDTLTEQTARGYHMFFRGDDLPTAVGNGCEFKTHGVCMVAPSVHPAGVVYQVVNPAPLLTLDKAHACALFPFLSAVYARSVPPVHPSAATPDGRNLAVRSGNGVVARIKAARSILAEMQAAGVSLQPGGTTTRVGLCPFHDDHSPSLWVNPESGLWGCNQPQCPAAGTHDVINFRALRCHLSNRAAIRQLADEFL